MIILSDEPKTLVLAAERLLDIDANIRTQYTIDELAFRLNDYIRELREKGDNGGFIGTSGFYIFYFKDADGYEEVRLMLGIADFYRYPDDPATQQFIHKEGGTVYDESCPAEWVEEDAEGPQ